MNARSNNAAQRLLCLPEDRREAAANMAIDLWMLRTAGMHPGAGTLFHGYGWSEPAFTFGQSQRWHDIRAHIEKITRGGRPVPALIRRPTGGGLVDHRRDWTYALVFPARSAAAADRPAGLYIRVHHLLADALGEANVAARLKECPPPGACSSENGAPAHNRLGRGGPSVCFDDPVPGDLLDPATGVKVAGAAMKRTRDGVLFQGSVVAEALAFPAAREVVRRAFLSRLAQSLDLEAASLSPPPAPALAALRATFRSTAWNLRR
ncbi:MAG: lipoate--protein ligase family protein [Opitutales bacterium]|nr:lipoate--protein ligase family protein [Opitutales bacterium]